MGGFGGAPVPPVLHLPLCQDLNSYVDLKCLLCVCLTVKIQFDNTSTCITILVSTQSYSSSARPLGPLEYLPPHSKILDPSLPLSHKCTYTCPLFDTIKTRR